MTFSTLAAVALDWRELHQSVILRYYSQKINIASFDFLKNAGFARVTNVTVSDKIIQAQIVKIAFTPQMRNVALYLKLLETTLSSSLITALDDPSSTLNPRINEMSGPDLFNTFVWMQGSRTDSRRNAQGEIDYGFQALADCSAELIFKMLGKEDPICSSNIDELWTSVLNMHNCNLKQRNAEKIKRKIEPLLLTGLELIRKTMQDVVCYYFIELFGYSFFIDSESEGKVSV